MKWKLVPAEQFYELMFSLAELERNGALPYQLEGMAAAIEAAPTPEPLSDERLFHYAAEIRKALEPDPVGATLNIVALLRAIEREILGGSEK